MAAPSSVLVVVVVELRAGNDLAGQRRFRRVVTEHRDFDLAAGHHLLGDDPLVELERVPDRDGELTFVVRLRDADARAHVRRLDEAREAELLRGGLDERVDIVAVAQREVRRDREPGAHERALHHDLVHADRGAEHTGADVRQARELEQALHRAVFAVRTVQHRQHDVDADVRGRSVRAPGCDDELATARFGRGPHRVAFDRERGGQRVASRFEHRLRVGREHPRTVGRDADRHDLVPVGIERLRHRDRGHP